VSTANQKAQASNTREKSQTRSWVEDVFAQMSGSMKAL
jgi:hypothetical protein